MPQTNTQPLRTAGSLIDQLHTKLAGDALTRAERAQVAPFVDSVMEELGTAVDSQIAAYLDRATTERLANTSFTLPTFSVELTVDGTETVDGYRTVRQREPRIRAAIVAEIDRRLTDLGYDEAQVALTTRNTFDFGEVAAISLSIEVPMSAPQGDQK